MRWLAVIACLAVLLILVLTGYTAYNTTTVLIPDYGGEYVEGTAGNPRYLNPLLSAYNDVDRDISALVFNGLTVADAQGRILPDLAETWSISPDGLSYTFYLRTDVHWHDGVLFTADDVVFTTDLLRSSGFPGQSDLADLWGMVKVERSDAQTVRFTLDEPFAPFLHYTTIGLLPAHILEGVSATELPEHPFNLNPVGTGPFKVAELTAGHVLLSANAEYYAGRPFLSSIELVFYPDWTTALAAYRSGQVHAIGRIPSELLQEAQAQDGLTLYSAPLSGYSLVFLNLDRPVFRDKEVRQALLWATDRERIINQILDDQALVADGSVPPFSWAYEAHATQYGYDPSRAEALLDRAGWIDTDGDGVREKGELNLAFTLLTNDDATRIRIVEELVRQWAEVGIRAEGETAGLAGLVRDYLVPREFDALLYEWQRLPTDPDPYSQWHSTQASGSGQNFAAFSSERADLIMEEARQIPDDGGRSALYRELQRLLAEEVPVLPLYRPVYTYAVDQTVHDIRLGPMWDAPDRFRTITEWHIGTRRVMVSEAPFLQQPGN